MNKRDYSDPEYKRWRALIRKRDNHTCQFPNCNSRKRIEVHHILPWEQYPGLRYHLQNGISLCQQHHRMITGNEANYTKLLGAIVAKKGAQQ